MKCYFSDSEFDRRFAEGRHGTGRGNHDDFRIQFAKVFFAALFLTGMLLFAGKAYAAPGDATLKTITASCPAGSDTLATDAGTGNSISFRGTWPGDEYTAVSFGLVSEGTVLDYATINGAAFIPLGDAAVYGSGNNRYFNPDVSAVAPGQYRVVVFVIKDADPETEEVFYSDVIEVIAGDGYLYNLAATTVTVTSGGVINDTDGTTLTLRLSLGNAAAVTIDPTDVIYFGTFGQSSASADFRNAAIVSPEAFSIRPPEGQILEGTPLTDVPLVVSSPYSVVASGEVEIVISGITALDENVTSFVKFIDGSMNPLGHWEGSLAFTPPAAHTPQELTDVAVPGLALNGSFSAGATITATQETAESIASCQTEFAAADSELRLLALYNINVTNGTYQGDVTVTIPVDAEHNGKTVSILHCNSGAIESKEAVVADGKVSAAFSSLSPFGVVLLSDELPQTPTYYKVWTNGERFASDHLSIACGDGTAVYDPATSTLTLTNATISTGCDIPEELAITYCESGIFTMVDLNVVLVGDNVIEDTDGTGIDSYAMNNLYMDIVSNISISGSGNLTITETATYDGYGVCTKGDLAINGVNITINCAATGLWSESSLSVTNSVINITNTGEYYYGIVVNNGDATFDGSVLIGNRHPITGAYSEEKPFIRFGDGSGNGHDYTLANNSVVITYDETAAPFTAGTNTGIVSDPAEVAQWASSNGNSGISYTNGSINGFAGISDITVATSAFADGNGSQSNPYQIATAQQLANLNNYPGSGYANTFFQLVADIDLASYITDNGWTPIGTGQAPFMGKFDGNGYTVSNLSMTGATLDASGAELSELFHFSSDDAGNGDFCVAGLFGYLKNATVANITLDGADISFGHSYDYRHSTYLIGALAAVVEGGELRDITLTNSQINHSCHDTYAYEYNLAVGGIAGYLYNVRPASGLVAKGVSVECTTDAWLNFAAVGGVVGASYQSVVVNAASVETTVHIGNGDRSFIYAGGIAGYTSAANKMDVFMCLHNSYSRADVSIVNNGDNSTLVAGGLAGYLEDAAINNYYVPSSDGVTVTDNGTSNNSVYSGKLFGLVHNAASYTITRNYCTAGGNATGGATGTGSAPEAVEITDETTLLANLNGGREAVAEGVQAQYGAVLALEKVYAWKTDADVNGGWPVHTAESVPPPPAFVAVTGITGVPTTATAGTGLTLTGTVAPENANNKAIVWSVKDAGTTGATISGNTLNTTAAGTAIITATIANGATASSDYTQDFVITVNVSTPPPPPPPVAPAITTGSLPDGTRGEYYSASLSASGTQPVTWSIISGALPVGLTLTTGGAIQGTPTVTGTFVFTARASNAAGNASRSFSITIVAPAVPVTYSVRFELYSGDGSPITGAVITFNGITYPAGVYTFSNLPAGTYAYTVTGAGFVSQRTGSVTVPGTGVVTLRDISIVASESIASAVEIWSSGGRLYVRAMQEAEVRIFTVAGTLQTVRKLSAGTADIQLPKGIYIVKTGDTVRKVSVN